MLMTFYTVRVISQSLKALPMEGEVTENVIVVMRVVGAEAEVEAEVGAAAGVIALVEVAVLTALQPDHLDGTDHQETKVSDFLHAHAHIWTHTHTHTHTHMHTHARTHTKLV